MFGKIRFRAFCRRIEQQQDRYESYFLKRWHSSLQGEGVVVFVLKESEDTTFNNTNRLKHAKVVVRFFSTAVSVVWCLSWTPQTRCQTYLKSIWEFTQFLQLGGVVCWMESWLFVAVLQSCAFCVSTQEDSSWVIMQWNDGRALLGISKYTQLLLYFE